MIVLGLPIVVAIVVAIGWAASRRGTSPSSPALPSDRLSRQQRSSVRPLSAPPRHTLDDDLDRWVTAGLLSAPQSDAIRRHEQSRTAGPAQAPATPRRREIPAMAEALGYLGGALAIIGLALFVGRRWVDIGTAGRLALSAAAAAGLLGAGALVRELAEPALDRLRQALWLLSTSATALLAGVVANDVVEIGRGTGTAAVCAAAVALQSGLLWRWRGPLVQLATCLIGGSVLVGTGVSALWSPGPAGIALWLLGAAYIAIGLRRRIVAPLLAVGVGAFTTVAGAATVLGDWPGAGLLAILGTGLGLATLAGVEGPARERDDRIVLGVIGGIALLQATPSTLGYFARDAGLITGLSVWAAGLVLTAVAAHRRVRVPLVALVAGGLAVLGGAALTATQATGFATVLGIASAVGLLVVGT
ncbi:MAG TPA: DUF2157 domain-containing protein, partial [Ilumatobacteraceae bacterium]|nr:DUF2157 domain-containing protein [Ilumatobacteraceae bacterium]